jgi:predicted alpha/beta-hydrolase family hydrolase
VTSIARDVPNERTGAVLVLGHGAGGDLNDPLLVAVGARLSARGVRVVRFNFPYREAGRRAPGSQADSERSFRDIAEAESVEGLKLFCGGKSYGGRIASHITSSGFAADGLVLLSYPLHPPGKPERLRDAHLAQIDAPMLFVHGTRDAFARGDLIEQTVRLLPTATLVQIDGGDHSLRVRGRSPSDVYAEVVEAIAAFVDV